jgi:hypothetical protein
MVVRRARWQKQPYYIDGQIEGSIAAHIHPWSLLAAKYTGLWLLLLILAVCSIRLFELLAFLSKH